MRKGKKEENYTELQKLTVEPEVYNNNNNKKCDWKEKAQKLN